MRKKRENITSDECRSLKKKTNRSRFISNFKLLKVFLNFRLSVVDFPSVSHPPVIESLLEFLFMAKMVSKIKNY